MKISHTRITVEHYRESVVSHGAARCPHCNALIYEEAGADSDRIVNKNVEVNTALKGENKDEKID